MDRNLSAFFLICLCLSLSLSLSLSACVCVCVCDNRWGTEGYQQEEQERQQFAGTKYMIMTLDELIPGQGMLVLGRGSGYGSYRLASLLGMKSRYDCDLPCTILYNTLQYSTILYDF
eukprot:COSAG05_NODE_1309_length_5222_cov_9.690611_8_plen_117_part_00